MADYRSDDMARSGWSMFAGVWLAVAGLFNAIDGLVALLNKEYFNAAGLVYDNLQVWGWAFLIIGIIQGLAGWLVIGRNAAGRWLGLVIAVISMMVAFFAIGGYSWWSLLIVAADAAVIWGLTARWQQ